MHYTIEFLLNSNSEILGHYQRAVGRWNEIWHRLNGSSDIVMLATWLSNEQFWFEKYCGGRWIGQEIMVVSGIAMMYSTREGFGEREMQARFLYDAFQRSMCSIEVKGIATEVAKSYNLISDAITF